MALRDQLNVMVVDDMSTSRGIILQALDGFGIRNVQHASNGFIALQQLSQRPVHLILSDYNMPEMDGLHLLHALRSASEFQRIGFILITGKADRRVIETGRQLGMNNFIKKPFTAQELLCSIEAVVGRI